MRDRDYTAATDFLKRFFAETLHNVELRAIAHERGAKVPAVFSRREAELTTFCQKHDVDGWGTYFGTCTRRLNTASGNAENVVECPALWVDIDCAAQGISGDDTLAALQFLPFPPSIIVNSGGGIHAYWMLEELANVAPGSAIRDAAVGALRQLAHILAGDTQCAEIARIMRLPGTANSKPKTLALYDGQPAICEIVEDTGRVYDLETLCEWLSEQRSVLQGRVAVAKPVNVDDPFVAYARSAGFEPAIDIDAALAAMSHEGASETSIHGTQLRVSASMIARGYDDDEIVDRILAATEGAAPRDAHWNWRREEAKIRGMIATGRSKGYDRPRERPQVTTPQVMGNTVVKLVREAEPKPKTAAKESKTATVAVGKATIGVWQDRHGPVMHTSGTTYAYEAGVWVEWDDRMAQRLRAIIQEACASLGIEPKTAILGAAKAYFMDRPELNKPAIDFDLHGLIIAEDGVLDPATGEVGDHSPDHYALFKVGALLHGARSCPTWLSFIAETFSDKPNDEAAAIISTVQEWFGAMLVPAKPRSLKMGLLAHGDSRTGKTQIAQVARGVLGMRHVTGARMRDLEGRFGMEPFLGKRGWIADDAIGEGEFLDADTYKVVVTGERTSVQCKGGRNVETSFGFPVMLTANNLPKIKDQSDAVYNRSLILPCTKVRDRTAPEPAGYNSIAEKVIAEDLTGVLWWAFEGWKRLSSRGFYTPPATMLDAIKTFEASNNPVHTWRGECLEIHAESMVTRNDLLASMNGWWTQEYGPADKPWGGRWFFPKLTNGLPGYSKDRSNYSDDDGVRHLVGVRLSKLGLIAWRTFKDSRWGETSKTSGDEFAVNKAWAAPAEPLRKPRF